MADENLILRYLTDLDPASGLNGADVFHVNQGGVDMSITLDNLIRSVVSLNHPIGKVVLFSIAANPNLLFPGTTWARLPNAGAVIRMSNDDTDVGDTGGSDSVSLTVDNLPAHNHFVDFNTQDHNFGQMNTEPNGNHNHGASCGASGDHQHQGGARAPGAVWGSGTWGTDNQGYVPYNWTSINGGHTHAITVNPSGDHAHGITLPNHAHTVSGNTNNTGAGTQFSVINRFIKLAAWHRTA